MKRAIHWNHQQEFDEIAVGCGENETVSLSSLSSKNLVLDGILQMHNTIIVVFQTNKKQFLTASPLTSKRKRNNPRSEILPQKFLV